MALCKASRKHPSLAIVAPVEQPNGNYWKDLGYDTVPTVNYPWSNVTAFTLVQ
jgi:hypothetical protein